MVNNLLTLRAESEARVVTVNHKFQTKIHYTLAHKIPSILNDLLNVSYILQHDWSMLLS